MASGSKFDTGWLCLDCELMPWSVKAGELIRSRSTGRSPMPRGSGSEKAVAALELADSRGIGAAEMLRRFRVKAGLAERYAEAVDRYDWPVATVDDLQAGAFPPACDGQGAVHDDKDHGWHMSQLAETVRKATTVLVDDRRFAHRRSRGRGQLCNDSHRLVEPNSPRQGGEGMVVKPWDFVARQRQVLGAARREVPGPLDYLRIIYGPEYTAEENLVPACDNVIWAAKRSLARREFALGLEALHRFVEREPLRRVHECVFAVLAMESEPVDPRL